MGKVRCAPMKLMNIPRLELQGAVLGIRLGKIVSKSHEFHINTIHYWSDSQTVVQWMHSTERRFKAFVSHRIAEILKNSKPSQWKWIPTHLNTADAGTRPLAPPKFVHNGLWVNGPDFLRNDESLWPHVEFQRCDFQEEEELKPCMLISNNETQVIKFDRFSSLLKLKRTLPWIQRFVRKSRIPDYLSVEEIKEAEILLCRIVQIESYSDEIKQDKAKPTQPLMGQLPPDRVTPFVRPFTYTGVDLFGPFNVTIGRRVEKRWAVIFTCLTVRAAHIELANDLSADSLILCLRNFINRRGTPVRLRSDNGTNFIAACEDDGPITPNHFLIGCLSATQVIPKKAMENRTKC
ncbi:uncharacterized protein [Musca autumnalis]|uniref:uncharacterized protein n=1 Tax=Musca autumnalis TaxID=221902 RepID=UPI003CEF831E